LHDYFNCVLVLIPSATDKCLGILSSSSILSISTGDLCALFVSNTLLTYLLTVLTYLLTYLGLLNSTAWDLLSQWPLNWRCQLWSWS